MTKSFSIQRKSYFLKCLLVLFTYIIHNSESMAVPNIFQPQSQGCSEDPIVFLTVSAVAKSQNGALKDRLIEINWNEPEAEDGDWVGLYDHLPDEAGSHPLTKVNVTISRGYIKTDYRLERRPLQLGQDPCLGYWISYIRNDFVIATNCLQIYPTWMQDHKFVIGDTPLHSLMIPGTHNSGSWKEYEGPASDTVFLRYLVNQDEPVYRQLMHGIRYLDLRVGRYSNTPEKYWINHNFYRMGPLSTVISDVKRFVDETNEIVILDFHRFPVGFDGKRDRHQKLVEYLISELGTRAVPSSLWPNVTPNEIWGANKSIIISYSDARTVQQYPQLWPPLPQEWGDKRSLPDLKSFLGESIKKRGGKGALWAAMAEFTPQTRDIVLRPTQGLRNMAQTVNIPMTYWFQEKHWSLKSNVIATDFFLGNNIIQMSINSNYKRVKCI